MYSFGIIGLGKMGYSIFNGIVKSNIFNKDDILIYDKIKRFDDLLYVDKIEDVFEKCKIVLLSIKPQNLIDIEDIAKQFDFKNKCIISILAGISILKLEGVFKNAVIVRAMPNTPALIGLGVTTASSNNIESKYYDEAIKILSSIGLTYKVCEEDIDKLMPINGSMPAYAFYFAKSFIEASKNLGVDITVAKKMCLESIISSCKLALESNDDLDTLINNVCSKGGTTIAGLNELINDKVDDSIEKCYLACFNRAKELGK